MDTKIRRKKFIAHEPVFSGTATEPLVAVGKDSCRSTATSSGPKSTNCWARARVVNTKPRSKKCPEAPDSNTPRHARGCSPALPSAAYLCTHFKYLLHFTIHDQMLFQIRTPPCTIKIKKWTSGSLRGLVPLQALFIKKNKKNKKNRSLKWQHKYKLM